MTFDLVSKKKTYLHLLTLKGCENFVLVILLPSDKSTHGGS